MQVTPVQTEYRQDPLQAQQACSQAIPAVGTVTCLTLGCLSRESISRLDNDDIKIGARSLATSVYGSDATSVAGLPGVSIPSRKCFRCV